MNYQEWSAQDGVSASAENSLSADMSDLEQSRLVELLSSGIVRVDLQQKVVWANGPFRRRFETEHPEGADFYELLGEPVIEGPVFCPLHTVRTLRKAVTTKIRIGEQGTDYFEIDVTPDIAPETGQLLGCLVELRDATELARVDAMLRKLLDVGRLLTDLSNSELVTTSAEDRRKILIGKINDGMQKILHYDAFEFRLYEEQTGRLVPFLAEGISEKAATRTLYAESSRNGLTGYVANTKKSFLCEDTVNEPNYLSGADGACCSLTVPILWYDKLIGTCNVESRTPGAFTDRDQYFLEIFTRDVASAIHTFDLLWHEKEYGAQSSVDRIFRSVTLPIDRIIQNASVLLDSVSRDNTEDSASLRKILAESRVIKDQIATVRQGHNVKRPLLAGRRILVVDKDERAVRDAHRIFEVYGCSVEAAPNALIALKMIHVTPYDLILSEIHPDGGMSGFQLMLRLMDMNPGSTAVPLLLTTEFGYDPGHTIVKANAHGLLGVLLKPFNPNEKFFEKIEYVIKTCGKRDEDGILINPAAPAVETVPDAPKGGRGESRPLERGGVGFYNKQEPDRFRAWADRYADNKPKKTGSVPEKRENSGHPEIDAT